MLTLTRRENESIIIHDADGEPLVVVTIKRIRGHDVRVGVTAPECLRIDREEVFLAKLKREKTK